MHLFKCMHVLGETGFEPEVVCKFCILAKGKRGSSPQWLVSFALWRGENGVRALDALGVLYSDEGKTGLAPLAACEISILTRGKRGSSLVAFFC